MKMEKSGEAMTFVKNTRVFGENEIHVNIVFIIHICVFNACGYDSDIIIKNVYVFIK